MVEEKNSNESAIVAGDFSLKNKLKKLIRGKKTKTSDHEEKPNDIVGSSIKKVKFLRRGKIVLGTIAVILITIGVSYLVYQKINTKNCNDSPCKDQYLQQAVNAFTTKDVKKQAELVQKIQKEKNYQTNPDYLFILTQYFVNIGDVENSRLNLDRLKGVFVKENGYTAPLDSVAFPPNSIQETIEFMEQRNKEAQDKGVPNDLKYEDTGIKLDDIEVNPNE